jgi:plastocyanin domain-containing protein
MTSKAERALLIAMLAIGIPRCAGTAVQSANRAPSGADEVPSAPPEHGASQRIEIDVTDEGFRPAHLVVHRGQPVTLVFTRRTEKACLKEVIVYLDDRNKLQVELPLGRPIEIQTTFPTTGELGYSCGMKMYGGAIRVQ